MLLPNLKKEVILVQMWNTWINKLKKFWGFGRWLTPFFLSGLIAPVFPCKMNSIKIFFVMYTLWWRCTLCFLMMGVPVFVIITNSVEISPWRPPKTFRLNLYPFVSRAYIILLAYIDFSSAGCSYHSGSIFIADCKWCSVTVLKTMIISSW